MHHLPCVFRSAAARCIDQNQQESRAKETIAALKAEVAHLQRLAEAGQALSSGEEATLAALVRQKEELTKERDEQVPPGCHQRGCCRYGGVFVWRLRPQ